MHEAVEEIYESNAWRDRDYASFKANINRVEEELWNRMCVPMIYANWEGYVVESFKILLGYLSGLKLMYSDVPTRLVVVSLGASYRSLSGKQSFDQRVDFTDKFRGLLEKHLKFEKKIETKSNLNADVLKYLCNQFGFDFGAYSEYMADINRLVIVRNSIAHGENSIVPDRDNVLTYIDAVKGASGVLLDQIDAFLSSENYRLRL